MSQPIAAQGTISVLEDDYLITTVEAFLNDRFAQNLSSGTLDFYRTKLKVFTSYCDGQEIKRVSQLASNDLRKFLLFLESEAHSKGGIHAFFREVRTYLRWIEDEEIEPENWKNPVHKVKAPKLSKEILEPANIEDVHKMIASCRSDVLGRRDKAIMLFLLRSGVRAPELLALTKADIEPIAGEVLIRHGKGDKGRVIYVSPDARKALRAYLRLRHDNNRIYGLPTMEST